MNNKKKILDRHNPFRPDIKEWTDSAPVLRLFAYIKKHKDMELVIIDGNPALHFTPPIKRNQEERIDHFKRIPRCTENARLTFKNNKAGPSRCLTSIRVR